MTTECLQYRKYTPGQGLAPKQCPRPHRHQTPPTALPSRSEADVVVATSLVVGAIVGEVVVVITLTWGRCTVAVKVAVVGVVVVCGHVAVVLVEVLMGIGARATWPCGKNKRHIQNRTLSLSAQKALS